MRRLALLAVGWVVVAWHVAAAPAPVRDFVTLDLQKHGNHKLADAFHGGRFPDNHLRELKRGRHTFHKVPFAIGERLIQLCGGGITGKPLSITGISVGRKLTRLHFLHGTGYQATDGTVIGAYTVHYADGTRATIDIVYGKDVRDWWYKRGDSEVTRGKVAWEGSNAEVKPRNIKLRLYLRTWKNPHPGKTVARIDYTSRPTVCAPFCIAITAENRP
jgi:beta-galactosidase